MQNSHISIVAEDDTQIEVSFTDGTWSCPLCCDTPVFASEPQVTNHVISVHQSKSVTFEGLRYLKCNLGCDVLRQRMHYHCSQCDKAVISRGDFVFHLKSHRIPGQHRAGRRKGLAKTLNTNVSKIQLFSNSCAIVSANIIPLIEDPEAFWSDLESETGMNCLRDAVSNSFVLLQGPYHGIQKAYSIIEKYLITRLEKDMDLTDLASSHLISAADYQRPSGSLITAHATSPTELPERRSSRKRKVNSLFTDYVTPSTVDVEAQSSSHMQRPVAAPADLTSSHNDIIYALKSTVSQRCTVTLTKQPESDSEMYKLNMTFSRPELQGPVLEELKAEPIEDEPSSDEEEVEPNQCHSSVTIETIYAVPNTARSETVSVQATHASTRMECCFCTEDVVGDILTDSQLAKIEQAAKLWVEIYKEPENSIARKIIAGEELQGQNRCHPKCYIRFTAETKIDRAKSASKRKIPVSDAAEVELGLAEAELVSSPKKLRSSSTLTFKAAEILPKICILCNRQKYRKKRKLSLSKAETLDAGGLLNAARMKQDAKILALFETGDPVAREMMYHQLCHKRYISEVVNKTRQSTRTNFAIYTETWQQFLSRVEDFVIHEKRAYRLTDLHSAYIAMCKEAGEPANHRYGTAYWLEMCQLPDTHPWLYHQIKESPGCWTVQRQSKAGFSSLAADQTIEVTINRESKTSGGIKGITLTRGAVQRWVLSQPDKAKISSLCEQMAGVEYGFRVHKETDITSSSDSVLLDTKPLSLETSSVPEVHTESITEQYVLIQNVPESVKPIPSPKITFRCEECAKEFISLTKLIEHRKDCDQSKKTQNKTTPKPVEIIMPEKSFTKQHVCHKCGFEATVPQELKLHIARRHEEKTLRCEDCGEMFGPMIDLKYHIKNTGHAGGECANLFRRMVNCHICDKSLQMKNLRAHISMVHDKLRRYQCEICQKQFGTKFTLTEHMDIHKTEDERRRRFVCPVCHQAFFKKLPLDEHMSKHEGKPAYSCDICEKKFYHQSGYKRHMQHHSNVRAFVCRICGKGFKTSTNLSAHKSVHRPNQFICMCGKSYHQKHTLKLHQEKCLTHQDMMAQRLTEQQYPSTVTSGDVILPSSNATLLNLQSSDVPKYMCGFCKETFVHFSDVQEHVRLHVQEATDQLVDLDESQVGVSSQLRQLVEQETLSTDAHLVQQETLPSHTHFEQQETLPVHTQHDIHLHDTNGDTQGRSILVSEEQLQQLVDLEGSQTI